jgi:hypothetical protein
MKMKKMTVIIALVFVMVGSTACGYYSFDIDGQTVETGPMQEYSEEIPLDDAEEAQVRIRFGAGEIDVVPGDPDTLFSGQFRTNVAEWAPEVSWENGTLEIRQGDEGSLPITDPGPGPGVENVWELEFSTEVEMDMDIDIGASMGDLDLSGLALTDLSVETGASDLRLRFDEPNPAAMDSMDITAGAASLRVDGIGNASPERVTVRGGAGNLVLDLTGDWDNSADIELESGVGALTLQLPAGVGVRVRTSEGLGSVQADGGLARSGGSYTNDAYGESEIELLIDISVGVGSISLNLVD